MCQAGTMTNESFSFQNLELVSLHILNVHCIFGSILGGAGNFYCQTCWEESIHFFPSVSVKWLYIFTNLNNINAELHVCLYLDPYYATSGRVKEFNWAALNWSLFQTLSKVYRHNVGEGERERENKYLIFSPLLQFPYVILVDAVQYFEKRGVMLL